MSTFVNAFKQAGICPLNRNILATWLGGFTLVFTTGVVQNLYKEKKKIDESKVMPSNHFFSQQSSWQSEPSSISVTSSAESQSSQVEALKAMESVMKQETVQLYKDRFAEGYDLEIDEMYCVWAKLKALTLADAGCGKEKESSQSEKSEHASNAASSSSVLPIRQQKVSSVLDEVLTYPEPEQEKKKSGKPNPSQLPKHLSGEQYIAHIQQKKDDKKREDEKKERKQNRE